MTTVPQWITGLGIPEECVSEASSAEEKGRRFSVAPAAGDQVWRVHVDGCWLKDNEHKRVDYLFFGESASGRKMLLLVELKGQDFKTALQQIESTLQRLCKRSAENCVHHGAHKQAPGHDGLRSGAVRAFVVLSRGKGVPQRGREREKLRKKYGVLVHPRERQISATGLDNLPG